MQGPPDEIRESAWKFLPLALLQFPQDSILEIDGMFK